MAGFSFNLPDGKTFEIKGPPGLTKEQAQAIFDQQAKTGALVGFKPGDTLSAATQAANGLASAQAQVGQALSGITGALGAGIPGAAGAIGKISGAISAAGGALNGSLSGITAGLSSAVGPAVSSIKGVITGASGQLGSIATQAIGTINSAISATPVTAPIDIAGFAKQVPALSSIANMSQSTVTGVLAQAKNLVGQGPGVLSNVKGVGEFGFNASQLETAGILKPGTAALAAARGSALKDLLKSPAVYTGKSGIKSVQGLLDNIPKQAEIQQSLMAKGLDDLKAVGVPVNNLSAQGTAGIALSAAKSVSDTESLLKNIPVPGEAKSAFETAVRDGAYAVNLTETKVPAAFKAVDVPVPAVDTTNRETLDAATTRVLGNDKIPAPNYQASAPDISAIASALRKGFDTIVDLLDSTAAKLNSVDQNLRVLENQQSITQLQWDTVNSERLAAIRPYNESVPTQVSPALNQFETALPKVQAAYAETYKLTREYIKDVITQGIGIKNRVNALKAKIEGTSA
jgi:hypothetical protein